MNLPNFWSQNSPWGFSFAHPWLLLLLLLVPLLALLRGPERALQLAALDEVRSALGAGGAAARAAAIAEEMTRGAARP